MTAPEDETPDSAKKGKAIAETGHVPLAARNVFKGMKLPAFYSSPGLQDARLIGEQMRARQDDMEKLLGQIDQPGAREARQAARDQQALDLSAQLVEQQRQLVDVQSQLLVEQIRQGQETEHDRRLEYAVMVMAILAITVPLATTVAQSSHSWWWTIAAAAASLAVCVAIAAAVVRGRRQKDGPKQ